MSNPLWDDLPLVALLDDLWNHASAKWRIAHLKWDFSDVHHRSFWKKSLWHDIAALIANVLLCKYRNSPHVFVHIQICYTSCSSKHMTLNITTFQFSKHASTYITSSFFDMLRHSLVKSDLLVEDKHLKSVCKIQTCYLQHGTSCMQFWRNLCVDNRTFDLREASAAYVAPNKTFEISGRLQMVEM